MPDTQPDPPPDLDLRALVAPLWQRRWLIVAIVVAATAGTYLVASLRADRYRATATVLVENAAVRGILNEPLLTSPERATADQALLITSLPVAERVVRELGLDESAAGLLQDVSAKEVTGSNVVTVTAERASGASAAQVADAFVRAHIAERSERLKKEIAAEITRARNRLADVPATDANAQERQILRDGIARLSIAESVSGAQDSQVSNAVVPTQPVDKKPERDALFALVISALLAPALAYGLSLWRRG